MFSVADEPKKEAHSSNSADRLIHIYYLKQVLHLHVTHTHRHGINTGKQHPQRWCLSPAQRDDVTAC